MHNLSDELKAGLLTLFGSLLILVPKWIKVLLKRSDVEADRDSIEVGQGLVVLDTVATLKAEKESYRLELQNQGALIIKVQAQHEVIHQKNLELEALIITLKQDLAVAQGKAHIIETIASNLTLNMSISNNNAKINEKEESQ